MIRFLILIGYMGLMMYLQITSELNQYINVHYKYLATLSMFLAFILAIVQLIVWNQQDTQKELSSDETSHHLHCHGTAKKYSYLMAYFLLVMPLVVGYFFPTVSLDTTIVEAKGFNFPLSQEATAKYADIQIQYLKPDTSIFFNKDVYNQQMKKNLEKYKKKKEIMITDENYLEIMELIYNYPSEFAGKIISYTGFVFNSSKNLTSSVFVFRFGIIHCIADSGVYGLLNHLPNNQQFKNNTWIKAKGQIHFEYYPPLRRDLPTLEVMETQVIKKPANQYVYRKY